MGFQWLILLSMVFDGYGALVKPCNGFNGSFISRGGGHMVYEVIYLERCAKINISGGYLSTPVNLNISVWSSGRQASRQSTWLQSVKLLNLSHAVLYFANKREQKSTRISHDKSM